MHRQFRDERGSVWDVWDVYPSGMELERRMGSRRRRSDRRRRDEHTGSGVTADLRLGWLAFQAGGERRRLVPIPDDWKSLPDEALRSLKERATPSDRAR
jgi:hypothetical protein